MPARARVDGLGLVVLVISTLTSVVLALVLTWFEFESKLLAKLLTSTVTIALGSGFLLSASRVVHGNQRREG